MASRSRRLTPSLRPAIRAKLPPAPEIDQPAVELASPTLASIRSRIDSQAQTVKKSSAKLWALGIILVTSVIWAAGMAIGFINALTIQLVLALVLAVFGLASPALGLLAVGLLATLDAMAGELLLTGGLLRYNTVNYWLLIVMILYLPFLLRLRDFNSRALQVFGLLLALELVFSSDITHGMQDVLNIITTFGMVIYLARSLEDEQSLYWLGVVNGVVAGLGGLVYFLQVSHLPYANPNNWTFFQLTALFSICISLPYASSLHKSKLILFLLAAVNTAWIFLSGSRGSLLIALLCLLYIFLSTRSFTWKSVMIAIVVVAGLWISTAFVEQESYTINRIQTLFDPTLSSTKRTSKRSTLAEAGLLIFQQNPFGIGTGSFREELPNTYLLSGNRPAHSAWIKTLAENGVPGVLLLATFIGSFTIVGYQKRREGKFLFGLFLTIVFAAAFVAKEFRGKSIWFLAAAGIVMLHPEDMLAFLHAKLKETASIDYRKRLREVRFGRRR